METTQQHTTTKLEIVMSSGLLRQCLFFALIVLLAFDTAMSQSSSAEWISRNDLARAVVANELNVQDKDHSL